MRILVTGGVRSGKSRHAERLVGDGPASFVAAGPLPDPAADPDWAGRVAAHRAHRPAAWTTRETRDVAGVLAGADRPVLVDCLGTWLTGVLDEAQAWDSSTEELGTVVGEHVQSLVSALVDCPQDVVLVTNEVGLGVIPEHRSGRLFRDLLGTTNQQIARVCDEVHLVVAGRVLRI